ncbi:MAG TPA: DnaJ domain-containing protein [Spirochaetota bacterium]|nr:DnaJ domain-containing protein [Spirochaetota bacterium]HOM39026.1 DnaJ domain-containing protein [Spirochaetota bacterium]HPQ49921.1 DnaJ domain-containing protein [Spirochaetota bacterium]
MSPYYSSFKDYFKLLQVDPEAEPEVISAAYKALMKKYHPDLNADTEDTYVKEINEAYEILSDPVKREEYKKRYKEFISSNDYKSPYIIMERLKRKEEELKRREIHIKIREKILKDINIYSNENINLIEKTKKFISDFIDSKSSKEKEVFQRIDNFENKEEIIRQLLSSRLTLSKEFIIYEYILDNNIEYFKNMIAPAFKFKNLYPKIFDYLYNFNVKDYNTKIELIINSLNFDMFELEIHTFIKIIKLISKIFEKEKVIEFMKRLEKPVERYIKKSPKYNYDFIDILYNTIKGLEITQNFSAKFIKKIEQCLTSQLSLHDTVY